MRFAMGLRRQEITDEEAVCTAALSLDPVHPTTAVYWMMAEAIDADLQDKEARYTNPLKHLQLGAKKAQHDPSLERAGWVDCCSAALPRRDVGPGDMAVVPCVPTRAVCGPTTPQKGYYRRVLRWSPPRGLQGIHPLRTGG
jgi:hypothetical protein